jgi:O-antigen/teichoic acid export membrane protein
MVQARIDQLMLKEMISTEVVGHYSVALRMVEIFGFIPMMLQNSLMPSLINSKKASLSLYKSRLANYYRLNFALFLVIAVPIYFFADEIIGILFGSEYMPAAILLSIMSIRLLFANMGAARSSFILIENLTKFSLLTMTIGTVVNIGLNLLWIPKYEAIGSIYATIVSFTVTIFIIDFFHKKARWNMMVMLKAMLTFFKIRLDFIKNEENSQND